MKTIISIGTDGKILEGGRVYDRVKEYAGLVEGKYYCLVFTGDARKVKYEKVDGNFILKAIYGENKFKQILNLFLEIRKTFKKSQGETLRNEAVWYPQDVFEIGLISWILKKIFGGKLYAQCHTDISHPNFRNFSKRNYLQYLIGNFVFKRADKIRVVSQRMKNYLVYELNINEDKILNLPIYFDSVVNEKIANPTTDFLIMSRLSPEKNIPVAIQALENVRNITNLDLKLKIVGEGSVVLPKKDWITFAPWSTTPNLEYQNAKFFLLPSLYEGWALTAIESVANGTPVIMTNVGCANEFIVDGSNGIVSGGFDVNSFEQAVERAMQTNFDPKMLKLSLTDLDSKQEYLKKLKEFFVL